MRRPHPCPAQAEAYADQDCSQNITSLLAPLRKCDEEREVRILDLACGGGRDLKAFRERNCNVTGLDGSATLCLLASACCPEAEIEHADMATMELPAETYDGVVTWRRRSTNISRPTPSWGTGPPGAISWRNSTSVADNTKTHFPFSARATLSTRAKWRL